MQVAAVKQQGSNAAAVAPVEEKHREEPGAGVFALTFLSCFFFPSDHHLATFPVRLL